MSSARWAAVRAVLPAPSRMRKSSNCPSLATATAVESRQTLSSIAGRGSSTAPRAPTLDGITTPGELPASRKADSYSSSTLCSTIEAATRSPCLTPLLRQGIEVKERHPHRRIRQHRDHLLAAASHGRKCLSDGLAQRARVLHILRGQRRRNRT